MLSVFNDTCLGKQMDLEGKRLKEIAKAHGDGSLVDKDVKGRWCVFGPGVSGSKLSLSKKNPGADRRFHYDSSSITIVERYSC